MSEIFYVLIGYAVGIIVCLILCRPMKSFDEGYKAAKEFYSDWHKGFNIGWNCAFRAIKTIADTEYNKYKQEINE